MPEALLYPPRTNKDTATTAAVLGTLEIPPHCIEAVVVNDYAASILHPDVAHLATEEWLLRNACCAVTPGQDTRNVLSPYAWNRALPVAYGEIPFDIHLGNVVMAKGANVAGKLLTTPEEQWTTDINDIKSPIGYFGKREAEREIRVSNALLASGGRCTLPLGYLVLNEQAYFQYLSKQIPQAKRFRHMFMHMNRVTNNGDRPVILFRIVGTRERYGDISSSFSSPRQQRADIARGARLLLRELTLAETNETFAGNVVALIHSVFGEQAADAIVSSLKTLKSYQPLTLAEGLLFLLAGLDAYHARACQNIQWGITPCAKDIDCAHFLTDFELGEPGDNPFDPNSYFIKMWWIRYHYISAVGTHFFPHLGHSPFNDQVFFKNQYTQLTKQAYAALG